MTSHLNYVKSVTRLPGRQYRKSIGEFWIRSYPYLVCWILVVLFYSLHLCWPFALQDFTKAGLYWTTGPQYYCIWKIQYYTTIFHCSIALDSSMAQLQLKIPKLLWFISKSTFICTFLIHQGHHKVENSVISMKIFAVCNCNTIMLFLVFGIFLNTEYWLHIACIFCSSASKSLKGLVHGKSLQWTWYTK